MKSDAEIIIYQSVILFLHCLHRPEEGKICDYSEETERQNERTKTLKSYSRMDEGRIASFYVAAREGEGSISRDQNIVMAAGHVVYCLRV